MISRAENINPPILAWARRTAGLSLDKAASRIGLQSNTRGSATEKLEALERGELRPTRKQLIKIANVYRRPLTVFYRSNPPPRGDRGEDFRSFPGSVSREESALLDTLLREIRTRQEMVRSILEDDADARPLAFVGSMQVTLPIREAAQVIRQELEVPETHELWRKQESPDQLFAILRERVEQIGVFVLLAGNLGSHHTNLSEKIFRGFALADAFAPFIVINDQDARSARSFTLIYELTHIFVGSTGVSDAPSTIATGTQPARVERFCNDVAGEFLLPEESLAGIGAQESLDSASEVIRRIAARRSVSEAMVAYRFWRTGRIDPEVYGQLAAIYAGRWRAIKQRNRQLSRESGGVPINFYRIRKHRLGNRLTGLVSRTLKANEITHTKAAKILGVKPTNVETLLKLVD